MRSQDIASVVVRLLSNPDARERTWEFLRERFADLDERAIWFMWKRIVDALPMLGTRAALAEMHVWFEQHPMPETSQSVAQAVESMELELDFRERVRPALARWLARRLR